MFLIPKNKGNLGILIIYKYAMVLEQVYFLNIGEWDTKKSNYY